MRKALATEIVPLGDAHREEIVSLFVNAFFDYPLFQILLAQSGGDYRRMLENIMQFWVDIYIINRLDVIGCRREGRLVAAAMIDAPGSSVDGEVVGELRTRLISRIGNDIYSAFDEFELLRNLRYH